MKKKLKIKYSNLFIFIVIVYILVEVLIYLIGYFTKLYILEKEEINLKFTAEAVVKLEEVLLKSYEDGIIDYFVDDYQKVAKGKLLCVLNSSADKSSLEEIKNLKEEIKKLEFENNKLNGNILENKKEQLTILQNQNLKYFTDYKATMSAVVSFKYDKYATKNIDLSIINFKKIKNEFIDIEKEKNYIKKDEVVIRLINPNEVYILFLDYKKNLYENQQVEINFKNKIFNGKVENIYKKNNKNIVLLKIIEQNNDIYITRVGRFDIIYKKIEGFKIPVSSVKKIGGKIGVYVVNEETKMPEFVKINKIYYKDEKYVYVDYNKSKNNKNNLKLYDRILLYPNIINKNIKVSR